MKIKCVKLECQCKKMGLAQLFLNKEGNIKYARIRHYSHINAETHKPQFTYCKIEDIEALKTLLKSQGISLSTEKAESGQLGQCTNTKVCDLVSHENSSILENKGGRSLAWLGHQVPNLTTRVQIPVTAP
jgi:hypothetical protein